MTCGIATAFVDNCRGRVAWRCVAWRLGKGRCIIITAIISVVGANTFRGALHLNAVKDRAV